MAAFLAVRAAGVGRQPRYYWAGRDRPLPGTVGRAAGDRWSWGLETGLRASGGVGRCPTGRPTVLERPPLRRPLAWVGRQPRYYWAGRDRPLPGTVGRGASRPGLRASGVWAVARQGDLRFPNGPRCVGHWPGRNGNHGIT